MLRFLLLDALAATRGDGLRPELRNLLERLAEAQKAAPNAAIVDDCHLANAIDSSSRMTPTRRGLGVAEVQRPVNRIITCFFCNGPSCVNPI
jgi:hypothetical protein